MNFLLIAVVIIVIGVAGVLWRNRSRTTMDDTIGGFSRGLDAIAPEKRISSESDLETINSETINSETIKEDG